MKFDCNSDESSCSAEGSHVFLKKRTSYNLLDALAISWESPALKGDLLEFVILGCLYYESCKILMFVSKKDTEQYSDSTNLNCTHCSGQRRALFGVFSWTALHQNLTKNNALSIGTKDSIIMNVSLMYMQY